MKKQPFYIKFGLLGVACCAVATFINMIFGVDVPDGFKTFDVCWSFFYDKFCPIYLPLALGITSKILWNGGFLLVLISIFSAKRIFTGQKRLDS